MGKGSYTKDGCIDCSLGSNYPDIKISSLLEVLYEIYTEVCEYGVEVKATNIKVLNDITERLLCYYSYDSDSECSVFYVEGVTEDFLKSIEKAAHLGFVGLGSFAVHSLMKEAGLRYLSVYSDDGETINYGGSDSILGGNDSLFGSFKMSENTTSIESKVLKEYILQIQVVLDALKGLIGYPVYKIRMIRGFSKSYYRRMDDRDELELFLV